MPRVHWKQLVGFNSLAAGIFGFMLVGLVCLGLVGFGVYQTLTSRGDSGGSGEVLTVLGMYFSVPYLFVLAVFTLAVFDFKIIKNTTLFWTNNTTLGFVIIVFLIQQAFANVYIVLLHGPVALTVLIGDFIVLGMLLGWKLCPNTCVAYVLLFATKMGLVWGDAWKFSEEPVFGVSGFSMLLFVCIPVIQLTLFSPQLENEGISQAFVSRFNIATTHLLHSLDIISFFTFCFRPLGGSYELKETPTPLRWMMLFFVLIAFCANNLGIPLLFFRKAFRAIQMPTMERIRASSLMRGRTQNTVSHHDFNALANGGQQQQDNNNNNNSSTAQLLLAGNNNLQQGRVRTYSEIIGIPGPNNNSSIASAGGNLSNVSFGGTTPATTAAAGAASNQQQQQQQQASSYDENEQMLTFMLVMLMLCDFPFLATRFALWSKGVERMDVFAAKNIKDMIDVMMLLTRARGN